MIITVKLVLLVLAFVLFVLAAAGVTHPRWNLIGAGLACWVASLLFNPAVP
jgi:hypothetical protein